jgi:hypothetical protein
MADTPDRSIRDQASATRILSTVVDGAQQKIPDAAIGWRSARRSLAL